MILLFAIGYAIKLVCFRCIDALDVFSKNENFGDYIDLTGYLKILIKHQALLCFSSKSELHLVHIFVKLHFECSLLFSAAVVGFVSVRHIKKNSECDCFYLLQMACSQCPSVLLWIWFNFIAVKRGLWSVLESFPCVSLKRFAIPYSSFYQPVDGILSHCFALVSWNPICCPTVLIFFL